MTLSDLPLWKAWSALHHVKKVWFIDGYEPAAYMEKKLAGNGYDFPFIINLNDQPIGFIQACDLYAYRTRCPTPKGVFQRENPGTFCFDLFIAHEDLLGKGYGTAIVQQFREKLAFDYFAQKIVIDPASNNIAAIRCYEKAGFVKTGLTHDGICEVALMQWRPDLVLRPTVRVILLNLRSEILLLRADDPACANTEGIKRGPFWFLAGGKIEYGETITEAVQRELFEETGLAKEDLDIGAVIWRSTCDLKLSGLATRLHQNYVVVKTRAHDISFHYLTEPERKVITHAQWFSVDDLKKLRETFHPTSLLQHLPAVVQGTLPRKPLMIIDE